METQNEIETEQDPRKEHHRTIFEDWLSSYKNEPKSTTKIIDQDRADKIIRYLTNKETNQDPGFKFYVKQKGFNMVQVEDKEVLYRAKTEKSSNLHSIQRGHIGVDKTFHQIKVRYEGLPKPVVSEFIKKCPI
ncbi:unnamed protein product, partial [Brachionus calyciflorus]